MIHLSTICALMMWPLHLLLMLNTLLLQFLYDIFILLEILSSIVEIPFEFQEHSTLFLLLKWGTYKMQTHVIRALK